MRLGWTSLRAKPTVGWSTTVYWTLVGVQVTLAAAAIALGGCLLYL
jgi:hypothetical protein